jgi:competence protein ComEA
VTGARALLAAAALLASPPALAAKKPLGSGERIDVGRASVAELMRLPNVGRRKAEAIAAARSRTPFRRLEDLLAVKGVSSGWLERNRAHLTVGGGAPVRSAPRAPAPAAPPRSR